MTKQNYLTWPLRTTSGLISDFLFPPSCLSCSWPIANHGTLCPKCWTDIDFITPPLCDRLGIPLPYDTGEKAISAAAAAHPPAYHRARAVAAYGGVIRTLIHGLKYRDRHECLPRFAQWLALAGKELFEDADLLIPVPLFWLRLWTRRFNQAAEMANSLSHFTKIPTDPLILKRIKRTKTQIGMTASQRKKNVSGAFQVPPQKRHLLEGKNIILIDDVITTGATIEASTKVLLRSGAARVDVLALARVTDLGTTSTF